MSAYIDRGEAARRWEGEPEEFFQGDVLQSLEFGNPRRGGRMDAVMAHALVISHDCEFTKARARDFEYPILVAPLREVRAFGGDANLIREGRVRALLYLPHEEPLDDEYAADLRLIQPVSAATVMDARWWTTLGPEMRELLWAKITEFLTWDRTLKAQREH